MSLRAPNVLISPGGFPSKFDNGPRKRLGEAAFPFGGAAAARPWRRDASGRSRFPPPRCVPWRRRRHRSQMSRRAAWKSERDGVVSVFSIHLCFLARLAAQMTPGPRPMQACSGSVAKVEFRRGRALTAPRERQRPVSQVAGSAHFPREAVECPTFGMNMKRR